MFIHTWVTRWPVTCDLIPKILTSWIYPHAGNKTYEYILLNITRCFLASPKLHGCHKSSNSNNVYIFNQAKHILLYKNASNSVYGWKEGLQLESWVVCGDTILRCSALPAGLRAEGLQLEFPALLFRRPSPGRIPSHWSCRRVVSLDSFDGFRLSR